MPGNEGSNRLRGCILFACFVFLKSPKDFSLSGALRTPHNEGRDQARPTGVLRELLSSSH